MRSSADLGLKGKASKDHGQHSQSLSSINGSSAMRCTLQLIHLLHHLPCPQLMHMPVKEASARLGISKESFRALVQGHGLKRCSERDRHTERRGTRIVPGPSTTEPCE